MNWFHFAGSTAKEQLMDLHHSLVKHGYMKEAWYVLALLNRKQLNLTRQTLVMNRVETLVRRVTPKITVIKDGSIRKAILEVEKQ